jgi:hypothetical protein
MLHGYSATYGGMAHSVVELMVVLKNLASGGRRGESCGCPGAASRVMARELLVWSPSVCLLKGWADEGSEDAQRRVWRCPVVPDFHGTGDDAAVPGMAAQWRRWPHKAGNNRGDAPCWPDITASSQAGAEWAPVRLSRVPPPSFEGCDVEAVREWATQRHGVDTGLPAQLLHSVGDGRTTRVGGTAPGYDSQAVSEGRRGRDSPLTWAPAACQSI